MLALAALLAAAAPQLASAAAVERMLLKGLRAKGATVDVCAIYLPNRSLRPDAFADGVGVALPPVIAAEMAAAGTRLASY